MLSKAVKNQIFDPHIFPTAHALSPKQQTVHIHNVPLTLQP